jgi:cell division protein FtsB
VLRIGSITWIGPGLLALFILPALAYAGYSVGDRWYQNYVLTQEEAALRADVLRLRDENVRLQRDLNAARGDEQVEKTAREQLGLIRPGDRAIQIVGPPSAAAAQQPVLRHDPAPVERTIATEKPIWLRLLDALFGH